MAIPEHGSGGLRVGPIAAVTDWALGRHTAIGLASLVLLALSGFATYRGMSDFITGSQTGVVVSGGIAVEGMVLAIVVALTLLMWIALRETVRRQTRPWRYLATAPLYAFLFLWSVGFGYGFWWSLIAGTEATRTGLAGQAEDARDAAVRIAARLTAVQSRLDTVFRVSERQMMLEETQGGSCGVVSPPGRGPLWQARSDVRDQVDFLISDIRSNWLGSIEMELAGLNDRLSTVSAAVEGATLADRQAAFERTAAEIRGAATEIAARSNALGRAYASEMRQLSGALSAPPGDFSFTCHDPDLAARLTEAAVDAEREADVALRAASFSEGAAGVGTAVTNLWSRLGHSVASALQIPVAPLDPSNVSTGRDLTAIMAALGVDLGLLVLALLNPPRSAGGRDGLARNIARVSLVNMTTVRELARAFHIAIHDVDQLDLEKLRMHFIAHKGKSFLVTPNVYRCSDERKAGGKKGEIRRGIAMNQVAGILDEYGLVRTLSDQERKRYWQDDPRRLAANAMPEDEASELSAEALEKIRKSVEESWDTGREAGLFGKARRAMQAAGWSDGAAINPEIREVIGDGAGGLTPLLMVLEEAAKLRDQPTDPAAEPLALAAPPAQLPAPEADEDQDAAPKK